MLNCRKRKNSNDGQAGKLCRLIPRGDDFAQRLYNSRHSIQFMRSVIARKSGRVMANELITDSTKFITIALDESLVFKSFLDFTKLSEVLNFLPEVIFPYYGLNVLIKESLETWITLEIAYTTLMNRDDNRILYVDNSYWTMNEDMISIYHATDPCMTNVEVVSRHCFDYFDAIIEWVNTMRDNSFETFEFMVLMQLIIMKIVSKSKVNLSANSTLMSYRARLLKTLHDYYQENFEDSIKRLDVLLSLVDDFQEIYDILQTYLHSMKTNNRSLLYERLEDDADASLQESITIIDDIPEDPSPSFP